MKNEDPDRVYSLIKNEYISLQNRYNLLVLVERIVVISIIILQATILNVFFTLLGISLVFFYLLFSRIDRNKMLQRLNKIRDFFIETGIEDEKNLNDIITLNYEKANRGKFYELIIRIEPVIWIAISMAVTILNFI